ncbi:MAG: hypothetical protein J6N72_02470 [Psychrobacter sp.]|nr:hypothetical protein [Psychrobacter sp.]
MNESSENLNNISLQPKMVMNINKQMEVKNRRKKSNIKFADIKKMQPLTFLVVTDPMVDSRSFALVDFDGMGFLYFEQSIEDIPSEKGISIAQRMLVEMYEINAISRVEIANIMQDKDLGQVYVKLHEKIAAISKKRYGVAVDSTLTTLNAMLVLNLVESENPNAKSIEDCRELARAVTDDNIEKCAWFVLRKREARYMLEREMLAAKL